MAHISVSEGAGQEDMGNDFPFQRNERETAARGEQGQPDSEQAERVEDSRLEIGQEGVAAVGIGVPQGQPPGPPLLGFKAGESVELIDKVAGGKVARSAGLGAISRQWKRSANAAKRAISPTLGSQALNFDRI